MNTTLKHHALDLRRFLPEMKRKYGVMRIGVFDCYIESGHQWTTDLNVLVELQKPLGWEYFELKAFIEKKLKLHINIFTPKALKPSLKDEIISKTHCA